VGVGAVGLLFRRKEVARRIASTARVLKYIFSLISELYGSQATSAVSLFWSKLECE
jgi:hypothetical protein